MNKKNIIIGLVAVLLLGGLFASAQSASFRDIVAQKAGEVLGMKLFNEMEGDFSEDVELGGSVFPSKWTQQGNLVTVVESGSFVDASTTILSVVNPFGNASTTGADSYQWAFDEGGTDATSTIVGVLLEVTGVATSSFDLICGPATSRFAIPSYEMVDANDIPSSTKWIITNNATSSVTMTNYEGILGTGDVSKAFLTPNYEYFNCYATGTVGGTNSWLDGTAPDGNYRNGIVGANNTFEGSYSIIFQKSIKTD